MLFEKNTRLVMIGDSITDCGRTYEAEPAGWDSFGDGYVNLINAFLTGLVPWQKIMVMNKGISGNRIVDLKERWQRDVLDMKPDWVSIMIGVNDVWRHFDHVLQQTEQVDEIQFESIYRELIEKTLPVVRGMIIISPFMIEKNPEDEMRAKLTGYQAIGRKLAEEYQLPFVDVQACMDEFLMHLPAFTLSADRVHPNVQGHMIIAKAFLDTIGFEWKQTPVLTADK